MDLMCYLIGILLILLILAIAYAFYDIVLYRRKPNLTGKHVVITGGSSGIGKSVAIAAAKQGANVTILARNEQMLQNAKTEISNAVSNHTNQKITAISCDITQPYDKTKNVIAKIESEIAPIFMLINCAGSAEFIPIQNASESHYRKMIDLNLMGTIFPTKAVIEEMIPREKGVIVITASLAALLGIHGSSAYCASKWALRGFAESIQQELAPYNISVTLVLPPDTDTPGFENENRNKPEETRQICESGGLYSPEAVAEKILSDAMRGRFCSTVGFEGVLLSLGCAGFSPLSSVPEVFLQVLTSGIVRLISIFHLRGIEKIVSTLHLRKKILNKRE